MLGMGIYDGLKDAASILKEAGKIEQYRQILEVQEKLLEMQKRINDLEEQNKELRQQLETKGKLLHKNNMYYLGNEQDGPYCTACWDSEHLLIRLHTHAVSNAAECPKCKTRARPGKVVISYPKSDFGDPIF